MSLGFIWTAAVGWLPLGSPLKSKKCPVQPPDAARSDDTTRRPVAPYAMKNDDWTPQVRPSTSARRRAASAAAVARNLATCGGATAYTDPTSTTVTATTTVAGDSGTSTNVGLGLGAGDVHHTPSGAVQCLCALCHLRPACFPRRFDGRIVLPDPVLAALRVQGAEAPHVPGGRAPSRARRSSGAWREDRGEGPSTGRGMGNSRTLHSFFSLLRRARVAICALN